MVAVFAVSVTERSEGREECAARAKANNEGWKSSAGEFLMICAIVLDWVSTNVGEHLPGEVELFRRLCDVIDCIQALKYGIVDFIKAFQTRVRSCVGYVSHACFHR